MARGADVRRAVRGSGRAARPAEHEGVDPLVFAFGPRAGGAPQGPLDLGLDGDRRISRGDFSWRKHVAAKSAHPGDRARAFGRDALRIYGAAFEHADEHSQSITG